MTTSRRPRRLLLIALLILVLLGLPVAVMALASGHPDAVAAAADRARQFVGPAPVAAVEDVFYRAADGYSRLRYRISGQGASWELTNTAAAPGAGAGTVPAATPAAQRLDAASLTNAAAACTAATPCGVTETTASAALPAATPESPAVGLAALAGMPSTPAPAAAQPALPPAGAAQPAGLAGDLPPAPDPGFPGAAAGNGGPASPAPGLSPLTPVISVPALPGEGVWQPLATAAQPAGQPPLLWQTVFRPDPSRPFAAVALVAMDLSRSRLHLVVGVKEPVSSVPPEGRRTGTIPAADLDARRLLAAWNGGFRAIHGSYGIMTDGVTWLPPMRGMQTVAINREGQVAMGPWGQEITAAGDWQAWRQNNPPLIDLGQINPDVISTAHTIRWGASIDGAVFIWRSGMGLAGAGRWLIYAAGNSLSVATLTAALAAAGCESAMQLDVNASWERFVTFRATPQIAGGRTYPLTALKLIDQMSGGPTQFLAPDDRDFFYLTLR